MATRDDAARPKWPWVWLFSMLPFVGWWLTGLFDLDEGFYGAVTAEMNRRGEWITPYYNGHPWFEKPILTYWVTKPFLWLFGDAVGPRLPSVLATAATFGIVIWFSRRRFSDGTAARAVLILATSLLFVALGRMLMTDPLLDLALVGAFLTFWESLVGDYRWRWMTAFCLGLGVLAKGPVALMLFVPLALWTFWREPELRSAFRRGWLVGTLILAATIATWYLPAYLVNGQVFVEKFLVEQNLKRFTGGDAAHTLGGIGGFVFYIPILLVGMMPWSFFLWKAWPRRMRNGHSDLKPVVGDNSEAGRRDDGAPSYHSNPSPGVGEGTGLHRYLAAWAAIVFLFFTISSAKLLHYVLPCCVPIALLVGDYLQRRKPEPSLRPFFIGCGVVALVANLGFWFYYGNWSPIPGVRTSHQREAQDLARELKGLVNPGDRILLYQLPRRNKALGTGKPTIQETSLPSLLMYLNASVVESDQLLPPPPSGGYEWILTRWNRIDESDAAKLLVGSPSMVLRRVKTRTRQDQYALWLLEPLVSM